MKCSSTMRKSFFEFSSFWPLTLSRENFTSSQWSKPFKVDPKNPSARYLNEGRGARATFKTATLHVQKHWPQIRNEDPDTYAHNFWMGGPIEVIKISIERHCNGTVQDINNGSNWITFSQDIMIFSTKWWKTISFRPILVSIQPFLQCTDVFYSFQMYTT